MELESLTLVSVAGRRLRRTQGLVKGIQRPRQPFRTNKTPQVDPG